MKYNQDTSLAIGNSQDITIDITSEDADAFQGIASARYWAGSAPFEPPLISKSSLDGGIDWEVISSPLYLRLVVHLRPADTASLPPGFYQHEAAIIYSTGARALVMAGCLKLTPNAETALAP